MNSRKFTRREKRVLKTLKAVTTGATAILAHLIFPVPSPFGVFVGGAIGSLANDEIEERYITLLEYEEERQKKDLPKLGRFERVLAFFGEEPEDTINEELLEKSKTKVVAMSPSGGMPPVSLLLRAAILTFLAALMINPVTATISATVALTPVSRFLISLLAGIIIAVVAGLIQIFIWWVAGRLRD